jgi:hypothetical protein
LELLPSSIENTFIQASFRTPPIGQVLSGSLILFRFGPFAHVGRLKLFKNYGLVVVYQIAGFLVVKVLPLVTNMSMVLANQLGGFSAAL